ncbi:MAG: 3-phosphoshikimate 1-carboxyvinyltransferase, partial [Bacteroides sp.]|nr:3-phosphoshikimate 1-carboxyvinyltransferase [Bacteroides sp.]
MISIKHFPNKIKAEITLPASKSISNRALTIGSLCSQRGEIINLSDCDDTEMMLKALAIYSNTIDVGAAGTAMRFLTAYFSVQQGSEVVLTGTDRMKQRPIKQLVDALCQLGADIQYIEKEGYPPLLIRGKKLSGGEVHLDANISSQYISAIMMIAPTLSKDTLIALSGEIASRPYIDMTMSVMKNYGADVCWKDERTIFISKKSYTPHSITIESDWSAASYWYAIASVCDEAELFFPNLNLESSQGDSTLATIFNPFGIDTEQVSGGVIIRKTREKSIDHLDINLFHSPDIAQTITTCCIAQGVHFKISGLDTLRIKETDRVLALQTELRKLGF